MAAQLATKFLTDRVALVTASTKGIGFAIAKQLGLDGAAVVVCSRKQKNVDQAVEALRVEGIDAAGIAANVSVHEDTSKLVKFAMERYGKLNVVVSNAAASTHYGDLLSISEKQWDKMFNTCLKSHHDLVKESIPHLDKTGTGSIIFVSSVAAYTPIDGLGAYSIMKSGLIGLSKALSLDLASSNIRVNAIAPGIIRTDFSKALYETGGEEQWVKQIPLGRLGVAEECAGAVSFLASDDASYMSGECIGVNGGMHSRI